MPGCAQQIVGALEHGDHTAALYALAPLFEQSRSPTRGGGGVRALARGVRGRFVGAGTGRDRAASSGQVGAPADAPPSASASSGVAKLWIGAGKKDEATVGDFVAVLIKEVGMERARIGRIELRDTFALVEVPAEDAEGIAQRLVGHHDPEAEAVGAGGRGDGERGSPSGVRHGAAAGARASADAPRALRP